MLAVLVTPATAAVGDISYDLPRAGTVSIGIYDSNDRLVQALPPQRQERGMHHAEWNEKDARGSLVPPGEYRWKLLLNPDALLAEYLFSIANDWPNGDYGTPRGVHEEGLGSDAGPRSVTVLDDGSVLFGAANGEGVAEVLRLKSDDSTLWITPGAISRVGGRGYGVSGGGGHYSIGTIGDELFALSQGGQVSHYSLRTLLPHISSENVAPNPGYATNYAIPFTHTAWIGADGQLYTASEPLRTCWKTADPLPPCACAEGCPDSSSPWSVDGQGMAEQSMDLAAFDTGSGSPDAQVVVSYRDRCQVAWFPPSTACLDHAVCCAPTPTGPLVTIRHPKGVAIDNDGSVLVISEGEVLRIIDQGRSPTETVATGLTEPFRLDVVRSPARDTCGSQSNPALPARGEILVAERGNSQRIRRLCPNKRSDGAFFPSLQTYPQSTRPPQSTDGRYVAGNGFQNVLDVAADRRGGFYVVEGMDVSPHLTAGQVAHPGMRRAAHHSANGRLQKEWIGGDSHGPFAEADPDDPSIVWVTTNDNHLLRLHIDYPWAWAPWRNICRYFPFLPCSATKPWKITHRFYWPNTLFPGSARPPNALRQSQGKNVWRVQKHDGRTYFLSEGSSQGFNVLYLNTRGGPAQWRLVSCPIELPTHFDAGATFQLGEKFDYVYQHLESTGGPARYQYWRVSPLRDDDGNLVLRYDCPIYRDPPQFVAELPQDLWGRQEGGDRNLFASEQLHFLDRDGSLTLGLNYTNYERPLPRTLGCNPHRDSELCEEHATECAVTDRYHCDPCRSWAVMRWKKDDCRRGEPCTPTWRIGDVRTVGSETCANCLLSPGAVTSTFGKNVGVVRAGRGAVVMVDRYGGACEKTIQTGNGGRAVVYAWSLDGLWIGDLFARRRENAPTPNSNFYLAGSDTVALSIFARPGADDALVLGGGINRVKVYRITGWTSLVHMNGRILVD